MLAFDINELTDYRGDPRHEKINVLRYNHARLLQAVRSTLTESALKYSARIKTKERTHSVGDRVLLISIPPATGSSKLHWKWEGPYRILEV